VGEGDESISSAMMVELSPTILVLLKLDPSKIIMIVLHDLN
jgi:hypothetical protein